MSGQTRKQPLFKRMKEALKGFLRKLGVKTLDMYMLKSFLGPFIAVFAIVTFILMMQFLWLYIDELVGKGLGFKVIFQFLMWGSCTLIPYALPLATLLASIMTMGNLGENSELLSMKAAGISLQRIIRPLSYVAVVIVVGAFFASNNLIPVAYNKIYTLREDITNTKEEIKIPVGIFYDGIEGFSIRVGSRDKNMLMHQIMIYNHTKENGNSDLTIADSGRFSITPDKKGFLITLYNGVNYQETNQRTYTDTNLQLQKIKFKFQQIAIPLENYAFSQSKEGRYSGEVMAKNITQLTRDKDSLSIANDSSLNFHMMRAMHVDYLGHKDQWIQAKFQGRRPVSLEVCRRQGQRPPDGLRYPQQRDGFTQFLQRTDLPDGLSAQEDHNRKIPQIHTEPCLPDLLLHRSPYRSHREKGRTGYSGHHFHTVLRAVLGCGHQRKETGKRRSHNPVPGSVHLHNSPGPAGSIPDLEVYPGLRNIQP